MLGLNSWSLLTLRTHVYCVINVTMCLFVCLLIFWQIGSFAYTKVILKQMEDK